MAKDIEERLAKLAPAEEVLICPVLRMYVPFWAALERFAIWALRTYHDFAKKKVCSWV